jgi:hypothetical protein
MRVKLNVPYAEKDQAKRLGVKWDPIDKVWFVTETNNLWSFLKWMPKHLSKPSHSEKIVDFSGTNNKVLAQRAKKKAKDQVKQHKKEAKEIARKKAHEEAKNTHFIKGPITPRTDFSMFDPGCSCVPWEWCEHNPDPMIGVVPENLSHIRSIMAE